MKNPIDELTEDQQQKLEALAEDFSERDLVARLAKPAPKGWGLVVSRAGLHAFLQRRKRERLLAEMETRMAQAREIIGNEGNPEQLEQATMALVRQHLFEKATEDSLSLRELIAFQRMLQQKKSTERREKLDLFKAQLEIHFAKMTKRRLDLRGWELALRHRDFFAAALEGEEPGQREEGEKLLATIIYGVRAALASKLPPEEAKSKREIDNEQLAAFIGLPVLDVEVKDEQAAPELKQFVEDAAAERNNRAAKSASGKAGKQQPEYMTEEEMVERAWKVLRGEPPNDTPSPQS